MTEAVSKTAVDVVRDWYANLAAEETFPAALEALDETFVVHSPAELPWGGEYHGPDGFVELITTITSTVTLGMQGEMQLLDAGDKVIVTAMGTFTSPSSGKTAVTPLVEVFQVRDGKLTDMDIYYKDPGAVSAVVAG
jgi:ketosteroid isomerase-like protein